MIFNQLTTSIDKENQKHPMSHLKNILMLAEEYERKGMTLPADLYAQLMAAGVDASRYNSHGVQEEIDWAAAKYELEDAIMEAEEREMRERDANDLL